MSKTYTIEDIYTLLEPYAIDKVKPNDDLQNDLGITGDDWFELIDEYAKKFDVDVSTCLWHWHTRAEMQLDSIFQTKRPYLKTKSYLPVTPETLLQFANSGKWDFDYPEDDEEQKKSLSTNTIFFITGVIIFISYMIVKSITN